MAYQPKSYRKFVAGAVAAAVVAPAVAPVAFAAELSDVKNTRYEEAVNTLADKGIVKGTEKGEFLPYTKITRGEAAIIVARALDLLDGKDIPANPFTDVGENSVAYEAIVKLADKGIISGYDEDNFGPYDNITRGQMAKVLAGAYELELGDGKTSFSDVGEDGTFSKYIDAIADNKIAQGKVDGTFGISEDILRGDFAVMVFNAEGLGEEVKGEGIVSVSAINDTRFEVTFGKAIDADVAREIEKDPGHFVAYDAGSSSQSPNRTATYVSFNADYTKAEIILDTAPRFDVKYTIALLDSSNAATADVVYKSNPTVLNVGAETPSLEVSADQEKFYLNFKEVMTDAVLTQLGDIDIFNDKGQSLANGVETLNDVLSTDNTTVEWVDATNKKEIKFNIEPGKLEAGKSYKVVIGSEVVNKEGNALSESKRSMTVKMPSVSDAQPKATFARVVGDTIEVIFDKNLDEAGNISTKLFTVKTTTGKEVTLEDEATVVGKKVTLTVASGSPNQLDPEFTYAVDVPANIVANKVFNNATNPAKTSLKAEAQADIAVKSVSAKFERDIKEVNKADLLLTFDQRVKDALESGGSIVIEESGKTFTITDDAIANNIEYDTNDANGKTLRIKSVEESFVNEDDSNKPFTVKADKSYTVKVIKNSVATDSANAPTNATDIKATVSGVDVSAPKLDEVILESAEKIVVKFNKDIVASGLDASDIKVKGFQVNNDGSFNDAGEMLQGSKQIKVSVGTDSITITPANDRIKFVTSDDALDLWIKEDTIKGKNNIVSSEADLEFDNVEDIIDNAAPAMVGAVAAAANELVITYTEDIDFKDNTGDAAGKQFTVSGAEFVNYATTGADITDAKLTLTFDKAMFKANVDYTDTLVAYKKQDSFRVHEVDGNKLAAANQTIEGVKNGVTP